VDAETERDILAALEEVRRGRTAVLISHRVAAVKRADQIVVLDQGRVVETGTHDELFARGGLYAELYRSQLAAELLGAEVAEVPEVPEVEVPEVIDSGRRAPGKATGEAGGNR
jgi:ABC-type glutathione transport system ATPase component